MTAEPDELDPKRIEQVYNALAQRVNTETTTFWARNNLFLVVNSGLIAVGFNQKNTDSSVLLLAGFGTVTCVIWFLVAQRGRAWLRFWENNLVKLEAQLPDPKNVSRLLESKTQGRDSSRKTKISYWPRAAVTVADHRRMAFSRRPVYSAILRYLRPAS